MAIARVSGRRLIRGVGAFVLADLITGLAAFSVIVSATLWYFCFSWIRLEEEYRRIGVTFGSSAQLTLAWIGLFALMAPLGASLCLAWDAYRLPRALLR